MDMDAANRTSDIYLVHHLKLDYVYLAFALDLPCQHRLEADCIIFSIRNTNDPDMSGLILTSELQPDVDLGWNCNSVEKARCTFDYLKYDPIDSPIDPRNTYLIKLIAMWNESCLRLNNRRTINILNS